MNQKAFQWLKKRTEKTRHKLIATVILSIIAAVLSVLFALLMRRLIDSAVSLNGEGIRHYSILIVIATLLLYVFHVADLYIQELVAVQTLSDLRSYLVSILMRKDYVEIRQKHTGSWMNLLFSDIKVISEGVSSIIPGISGMVSRMILSFVALIFLAPLLAGLYLVAGILILAGVSLFKSKLKTLHKDVQQKEDRLHAVLQEIIENILIIKAFGAEKYFDSRAEQVQQDYSAARVRRRRYRLVSVNLFSLVFRLGYLAALIYGGYQILNGEVSYGTLTAILHIVAQMQMPILTLSGLLPKIYETIASTERVMETEGISETGNMPEDEQFEHISIRNVSFSYDRDEVMQNVSFDINNGELVALTGASGGGKSTLFLLLLGMYSVSSGSITVFTDKGATEPGMRTRKLFAYVPQGNALFTGTIKENVVFNHTYNQELFENALKSADAYHFVMDLPDREETMIGERGTGLSEGQVQRLAIARAIYSNAPILLLDESTSALDEDTEARVLGNIKEMHNKTVLIVTHRPAALKICQRHLVIDNHSISEVQYE
ncbi:MAG: ABC transporter ATP-binding protein [Erysipelotrichaceae bacterium]|nr:ABC transporter ATP-binding protein [Erysipelotrichaceae bacterium]